MDESRKHLTKFIFQHTNIRETTLVNIGLDDVFKKKHLSALLKFKIILLVIYCLSSIVISALDESS